MNNKDSMILSILQKYDQEKARRWESCVSYLEPHCIEGARDAIVGVLKNETKKRIELSIEESYESRNHGYYEMHKIYHNELLSILSEDENNEGIKNNID